MKPAFGLIFAERHRRDGLVRLDRNFVEALARRNPDLAGRLLEARRGPLDPLLKRRHRAIGSINSPMQCALKEVCGQCLQPHKDPWKRKVSLAFSCFEQNQPLDYVDFAALHQRLGRNSLQEKATALWIVALPVS